ncbi:MAG: DUF2203 domain-containing protein [Candidatus Latescibacterota bacterium]|nr:MAG: DUF2203 domain-containing protein [Candidatus Latescibacterota bacterium]
MKNPKFFTVEEADQLIGMLETTLERIKRNKQEYLWLRGELAILELIVECGADGNNPDAVELAKKTKRFKRLANSIEKDVASLEQSGCVLRDIDAGIVDFFSIQDGTVVFLCWKKGEDSVKHWHSIRDGFAGRQPLFRSPSTR